MRFALGFGLVVVGVMGAQAAPPEAVIAALDDVKRLPQAVAVQTRYLDLSNIPAERLEEARQVVSFHFNSLSREADIVRPREVTPTLLAINLADYGINGADYAQVGLNPKTPEPYFHVLLEKPVVNKQGQKVNDRYMAAAPWLPTKEITELIQLTASQTPVMRADFVIYSTGIQADRDNHGYYDMLRLGKKEADFHAMVGADVKLARAMKKEMLAAVAKSNVTLNNRSIARMQTITGPYWFTQDYKSSKDRQNTVRLLDFSAEPPAGDASEQYGTLPNGLFAFWLQNEKGERQDTAPDFIASDGKSHSTDRRVHVGLSCIRCHTPGIQPIDDHARKLFQGEIKLVSPDYDKLKRLKQLYLSDLPRQIAKDQADYAEVLLRVNGLTPAANAAAYGRFWAAYEDDVTLPQAARELGCTPEVLVESLKQYGSTLDPILAGLLQTPPVPVRRAHFEEVFHLAQNAITEARK